MRVPALTGLLVLLTSCSGGSGSSSHASGSDFAIVSINVPEGATWKINRALDVTFNADVDFDTVSLSTIRVIDPQGVSATGEFGLRLRADGTVDPRTVRFRPTCPVEADYSDAGLVPGRTYALQVLGSKTGGTTVRSVKGDALEKGKLVTFRTPDSDNPLELFVDTVAGPPAVRLRGAGLALDEEEATYLDVGGERVYFELDPATQQGRLPAGFRVPLNHYSIAENRVSAVVVFNQAVDGSAANVSADHLRLQYDDGGTWRTIPAELELIANCTEVGASVRLSPRGILPQGH